MTILNVGSGQTYSTIAAAVAASKSGDTIDVQAGTYTNDFLSISHSLTIQGVGGAVNLVATTAPPNGKAIITEGAAGITVTLSGLTLSGAKVADNNGAGVRYEGGTLVMTGMTVTGNQEGLLGAADSNGSITITNSTFSGNGDGSGYTHNIYVGAIHDFTITGSTVKDALVGHDIKSRAANNTITGNVITDKAGTASYEIDLPNGGNAMISGNVIEKGANAQNPIAISYGEEGMSYGSNGLAVSNNVMVNDYMSHLTTAIKNAGNVAATGSGNTFYGWNSLTAGAVSLAGTILASVEPALSLSGGTTSTGTSTGTTTTGTTSTGSTSTGTVSTGTTSTGATTSGGSITPAGASGATPPTTTHPTTTAPGNPAKPPAPTGTAPITVGSGPDKIVVNLSEDAWKGDAQFQLTVDGKPVGGTLTATASHAAGASQAVNVLGTFGTGQHAVGVSFINDAYGGTAATDRNLYVDSVVDGGTIAKGAALYSAGSASFIVGQAPSTVTVGTGPKTLVLKLSQDAWGGDAQFKVAVDGRPVGGTLTASALHGIGQTQEFDIKGAFAPGEHKVAITFLNDAYGGTAATDRNLHIDQVGVASASDTLWNNGTLNYFPVIPR